MKTFKNISLGDKIFTIKLGSYNLLPSSDHYGNIYPQQVYSSTLIKELRKNEKSIVINPSNYDRSSFLTIDDSEIDLQSVTRNSTLYIVDERLQNKKLREIVLDAIRKNEESILSYADSMNNQIKNLRKTYYDVLNKKIYEL